MKRILLVDDETPARDRLRRLIEGVPGCVLVGEAVDGPAAIDLVRELNPDVVLLDIEMPGCLGTDVAGSLPEPRPAIIFCTAYDHYAVEAFALHADDYLLKPVTLARLREALERVPVAALPAPKRFLARAGDRYVVIPTVEIVSFLAEGGLTRLCTRDRDYWMDPTLNDLEQRLEPGTFFRASRAALIRLDDVKEVAPLPGGAGEALMHSGRRVEVSRRRLRDLLAHLSR